MFFWMQFIGVEKVVEMLYDVFQKGLYIVVVGDFDVDGVISIVFSVLVLCVLGYGNVFYLVLNCFEDGYGLSLEVVDQVYVCGVQMIMIVDNGILFYVGVDYVYVLGILVLVIDYYLLGEMLLVVEVIVNFNLCDCDFLLKLLVGVGVVFYLMLVLCIFLCDKGWFDVCGIFVLNFVELLDLVVLGIVVDVVLLDVNNCIFIWQGLSCICVGKCWFGIKVLLEIVNCDL